MESGFVDFFIVMGGVLAANLLTFCFVASMLDLSRGEKRDPNNLRWVSIGGVLMPLGFLVLILLNLVVQ